MVLGVHLLAVRAYIVDDQKKSGGPFSFGVVVDKKTKKRLEVLRGKLEKQQKLLKAAKAQTDEPGEVEKIESDIEAIKSEIAELKK